MSEIQSTRLGQKIYVRSTNGRFTDVRWIFVFLTQLIFYGLPWVNLGNRQALLFDLNERRFYIFNLVLYPQDLVYLTGLLVVAALGLFVFTAVAGRLWCGFACPQSVYSKIFLWIERQIEGDRSAQIRLDKQDFSAEKLVKKWYKQLIWIFFSIWTGFTFVGYFTPIRELGMEFFETRMSAWELFWVFTYALATYGNAGFLREQICKFMCPYARFQSAMYDNDTLIVTYDKARGEPRGQGKQNSCVDCSICVQVCPTGIDIRNGLQYECIGCGACVDACNQVMSKVNFEPGLIRFSTQNALDNNWTDSQIRQRMLRPRVQIYGLILLALILSLFVSLGLRSPFKVDVIRDRGSLAQITENGTIENLYRIQVSNITEEDKELTIEVTGMPELQISTEKHLVVPAAKTGSLVTRVEIPYGSAPAGSHKIQFELSSDKGENRVVEKSVFIVPR